MVKFFIGTLIFGLMAASAANEATHFPSPFKYQTSSDRCVVFTYPPAVVGATACLQDLSMAEAATSSGLFVLEDDAWRMAGPGVPQNANEEVRRGVQIKHGKALCGIEDSFGYHAAGATCFYGIAAKDNFSFTFRSKPIQLKLRSATYISRSRKAFFTLVSHQFTLQK